jgi:hypothetical protein
MLGACWSEILQISSLKSIELRRKITNETTAIILAGHSSVIEQMVDVSIRKKYYSHACGPTDRRHCKKTCVLIARDADSG